MTALSGYKFIARKRRDVCESIIRIFIIGITILHNVLCIKLLRLGYFVRYFYHVCIPAPPLIAVKCNEQSPSNGTDCETDGENP